MAACFGFRRSASLARGLFGVFCDRSNTSRCLQRSRSCQEPRPTVEPAARPRHERHARGASRAGTAGMIHVRSPAGVYRPAARRTHERLSRSCARAWEPRCAGSTVLASGRAGATRRVLAMLAGARARVVVEPSAAAPEDPPDQSTRSRRACSRGRGGRRARLAGREWPAGMLRATVLACAHIGWSRVRQSSQAC